MTAENYSIEYEDDGSLIESDPEFIAEAQAAIEQSDRQAKRAMELMGSDPKLPFISAYVIAGDLMSADRSLQWLRDGTHSFERAKVFTGSYGRLDFIVRALAEGLITEAEAIKDLPETWRGADPDDTDPRFLALWKRARKVKRRALTDGQQLPRKHDRLMVFRGQDQGVPFGIAWTLNPMVAVKFANGAATRQHARHGVVYVAFVPRSKVMGYMTGRNESEVVLDPEDLTDVEVWR